MEKQNYHPYLKTILIILTLAIIIVAFSLLWIALKSPKKKIDKKSNSTQITKHKANGVQENTSPLPQVNTSQLKGILSVKTENNKEIFRKDDLISLFIYAYSDNQQIVGYDVVLNYNLNNVEFQEHANLLSDFQVFVKKEKNKLLITGLKNINSITDSIFSNTPLIKLTFKSKAEGKTAFLLEFKPNQKNESNLINERSEDLLGKVEGIGIKIQ